MFLLISYFVLVILSSHGIFLSTLGKEMSPIMREEAFLLQFQSLETSLTISGILDILDKEAMIV